MHFLVIHWDVDPEIFRIGSFAVRWYGLLFASAFLFGYIFLLKIFKNENLEDVLLDKLTLYMALGVIIGARLGHCFVYDPEYYLSNPVEILKVWGGGLASHGGAVGILFGILLFVTKENKKYVWAIDRVAIVVALAGFFIRTGNLMNSEIYGTETTLPWGFEFRRVDPGTVRHPTQIYEALSYLLIFVLLYSIYWRKKGKYKPGTLISLTCILIFTARFFIEFLKERQVDFEQVLMFNTGLNWGQILSVPFILLGAVWLWSSLRSSRPAME